MNLFCFVPVGDALYTVDEKRHRKENFCIMTLPHYWNVGQEFPSDLSQKIKFSFVEIPFIDLQQFTHIENKDTPSYSTWYYN